MGTYPLKMCAESLASPLSYMFSYKLITDKQHGFMALKACVTKLLETMNFLTNCMSQRQPADVIYLDFEKAFGIGH